MSYAARLGRIAVVTALTGIGVPAGAAPAPILPVQPVSPLGITGMSPAGMGGIINQVGAAPILPVSPLGITGASPLSGQVPTSGFLGTPLVSTSGFTGVTGPFVAAGGFGVPWWPGWGDYDLPYAAYGPQNIPGFYTPPWTSWRPG